MGVLMLRRFFTLLIGVLMAVSVSSPVVAASSFTDVPDSNIFSDDIEWLAVMGITQGCNPPVNDEFCPSDLVTRGQMAALLVRALGLTNDGGGDHFTDDDTSIFETDIDKLYTAGITMGCNPPTNDNYCPNNSVTREQMAAFLRRGLDTTPSQVTDVIATLSGGSGEIDVSWDPVPDLDIDHYNIWYSELPGGTKTLITDPYIGPDTRDSGRWYIIDYPRSLVSGNDCYQVSAVDLAGQEGQRSAEACFDSTPGAPDQVTGVAVGLGGGSGEAYISWTRNTDPDLSHYNAYYSELPGGPYTFRQTVADDEIDGSNRVFFVDFPVDLTVGKTCYEISAVDLSGNEGTRSIEECFAP